MSCRWSRDMFEYFLYEAGAGRTPSLSLLPGCYVSMQFERDKDACQVPTRIGEARGLSLANGTGILRRGEGEVLVAELEVGYGEGEVGCLPCVAPHCPIVSSDDPEFLTLSASGSARTITAQITCYGWWRSTRGARCCCLSSAVAGNTTVLEIFYRLNFIGCNDSARFLHCHFASIKEELGIYRHYF